EESASSTQELTASMEDMTARAQSLSEMAVNLQRVAGTFIIDEKSSGTTGTSLLPVPTQRSVTKPAAKVHPGRSEAPKVPQKVKEALGKRGIKASV
ncbi:MAG: hypothetical protein SA339_13630, partial [Methanomassiliicoccus sp.]|nr:hypothetical protein [Methanomassiliicoccus sp.]